MAQLLIEGEAESACVQPFALSMTLMRELMVQNYEQGMTLHMRCIPNPLVVGSLYRDPVVRDIWRSETPHPDGWSEKDAVDIYIRRMTILYIG